MIIYLLRHAQAEKVYPDATRPLTSKGRAHAEALGQFMDHSTNVKPSLIWCSPYNRAQETLERVSQSWDLEDSKIETEAGLVPMSDPNPIIEKLDSVNEPVLIVGHNPFMESMASLLTIGEANRLRITFKTCTLVKFSWSPIPNYGELGPAELLGMYDPTCF